MAEKSPNTIGCFGNSCTDYPENPRGRLFNFHVLCAPKFPHNSAGIPELDDRNNNL